MTPTQLDKIKGEFFDRSDVYSDGCIDGDASEVWKFFDQKLREQYLQGVKDMRNHLALTPLSHFKNNDTESEFASGCYLGQTAMLNRVDFQAQQFIDSLEGKDGIKYNN